MAMDSSSFEGAAHESMEEKRELVYEISKWSHGASEILQSWNRQEILQILCLEMGKERKYTGLTKLKLIENLLKIVSEKRSEEQGDIAEHEPQSSPVFAQRTSKRQRKADHPYQLTVPSNAVSINGGTDTGNIIYCKNSACRASITRDDAFCKRCSCCICHQYDDNKDPSLWLICNSEPPFQGVSCGMSCHLECALKHEGSGIAKDGRRARLDGGFYCLSCGKMNDLLGCWRKQLLIAKDTRRVDILCYRVSLSQKLLKGTEKYNKLYEIVEDAVKKLEAELGPLTGLPVKMARGIVNRLSSGPEVQRLCTFALDSLESVLSNTFQCSLLNPVKHDSNLISPDIVRLEDVRATSATVILGSGDHLLEDNVNYTLWHRKAHDKYYPSESTCTLSAPNTRFVVSGLTPATKYHFKVVSFNGSGELGRCEVPFSTGNDGDEAPNFTLVERSQSPATNCSTLSNPSSVEDESNNPDNYHSYCKVTDKIVSANLSSDTINCSGLGGRAPKDPVLLLDEDHAIGTPNSEALKLDTKNSQESRIIEEMRADIMSDSPVQIGMECVPLVGCCEAGLPITPCKLETFNGKTKSSNKNLEKQTAKGEEPQDGSTSKKRSAGRLDEECAANGLSDKDFEYYVKVIRWLECDGHIDKNFRQKFLTWYSIRATMQEVRIVKVFIDTFIEDPASLAGQLVDTFSDTISSNKSSLVPAGFCMKLWH